MKTIAVGKFMVGMNVNGELEAESRCKSGKNSPTYYKNDYLRKGSYKSHWHFDNFKATV